MEEKKHFEKTHKKHRENQAQKTADPLVLVKSLAC
jgi:hypothetical protein